MFMKMLNYSENVFDDWKFPQIFKPAVGGLLLGLLGLAYMNLPGLTFPVGSAAHGAGHLQPLFPICTAPASPSFKSAIQGHTALWILVVLIFLKPIATSFTLGSGNSGGVFAPSLFTGAVLGGAMGHLFSALVSLNRQ